MVQKKKGEYSTQHNNQVPLLAKLVYGQYSKEKTERKKVLNHDEGIGSPCLNCDKCKGLDLHFWRKVCKNCGCKFEDHDIKVDEHYEEVVYNLLNDDIIDSLSSIEYDSDDEKHPLVQEFTPKKNKVTRSKIKADSLKPFEEGIRNKDSSSVLRRRQSRAKSLKRRRSKAISQYDKTKTNQNASRQATASLDDALKNSVSEQVDVEAERLRQRDMIRQIPPSDFDANFCREFDEFEKEELRLFLKLVQEEVIGQGIQNENNQEQTHCFFCSKMITSQQTYVTTSRITSKRWHDSCFKCSTCKEALVDDLYFAYNDDIYCGRHFGEFSKFRCKACDELIFSRQYCKADGYSWHIRHFCCFKCENQLGGCDYVTMQEQPYCLSCYNERSIQCQACQKSIELDGEMLEYEGLTWHHNENCFACKNCHKSLIDLKFVAMDSLLYCSDECWKSHEKNESKIV